MLKSEQLLRHVLEYFNSPNLRRHFHDMYLLVLRDHVLLNTYSIGTIERNQWIGKFLFIFPAQRIIFHRNLALLQQLLNHTEDKRIIAECLYLLIRHGPLHTLPLVRLRDQFASITNICQQLQCSSSRGYNEMILKMLIEFSNQVCWQLLITFV